jgi:Xylanase inhibitor C-terminal
MPADLRIPITNTLTGNDYTMALTVGGTQLNVLLDTGAGLLAVDGGGYDPSTDPAAKTTQLLQTAPFQTGSFMAAVVQTSLVLSMAGPPVVLPNANLAVTYQNTSGTFGNADGILGLAYAALDTAYRMPADTFKTKYQADQLRLGQPADLEPFISQVATAGLAPQTFAFAVRRSMTSQALDDPTTDPLNNGLFILGGGSACTDLYSGAFANVAVAHEQYYHTNLLSIQVGAQTINVPPAAPGGRVFSNSIIDSGASILQLDQGLYTRIIAAFAMVNPAFAAALQASAGRGCDQTTLDLTAWPPLGFTFQGSEGTPATIQIAPRDYWQFDCGQKGLAVAMMTGDNGALAGQSILGLPVFTGHLVVFDRTASNGHGVISFAARAQAVVA